MADFELRNYATGQVGWIAGPDITGDAEQEKALLIHIKNSENPFGTLVIRDEKQAMQLRTLLGDFLLYKNAGKR